MVKKKHSEQEENKEKMDQETADNKEHIIEENREKAESSEPFIQKEEADAIKNETTADSKSSDKDSQNLRALEEKLAEMQDKYIRLSAEFDNYRKRTLREKMDLSKYASEDLLLKLFPVLDDFERAISHMDTATDVIAMKQGIELIFNKFSGFLKQNGVKEVESLNCLFNVDVHDAVGKTPIEEEEKKGKIVDVIQKGYYLNDKVIRHAKVIVGE